MTFAELKPLFRWRLRAVDVRGPAGLAASLTVEGLAYDVIPKRIRPLLVAYRKRRSDERHAVCARFLALPKRKR